MDVSFINPFIIALEKTFQTMMSLDIKVGKPALKDTSNNIYEISGFIGLSGDAQGLIALSFSQKLSVAIVSKMLGCKINNNENEIPDAIGELVNIIAGYAKQYLKYNVSISLPNVIIGVGHIITIPSGTPTIILPIDCGIGKFVMRIALKVK